MKKVQDMFNLFRKRKKILSRKKSVHKAEDLLNSEAIQLREDTPAAKPQGVFFIGIVIAIIGIGSAVSGFYFIQYQKAQNIINSSVLGVQQEGSGLAKKVSKFILLPEGELPTIATVSDFQKLKDQPFFEKSQNGDKVLIYTAAKKAYLYRPSTDKLIDVTNINVDSPALAASLKPAASEIKIVLRNGTSTVGLTNKLEPEIKKVLPNSTIVKKENAANSDYQTTMIIVLNESAAQAALKIADYLKATITSLPLDEIKPTDGDILVIIGKDKSP